MIAPPKPIIPKTGSCSSQFARLVYPCDVLKLFTNRTFVTYSIRVSDQQSVRTVSWKHQLMKVFAWLSFSFAYFTYCVRGKTFLYVSCSRDTSWAQQVGINIAANKNQMFSSDQSCLSFYSVTVFSNCHIPPRENADGPTCKPPWYVSDLNLHEEFGL